jgi:hypothetical protein
MKRIAFALTFCFAVAAAGQQATDTTATTKSPDSPLVRAAKAAGGAKKKMPKKVITNADVKKTTGKLMVLPGNSAPAKTSTAVTDTAPPKGLIEQHTAMLRAQDAATERVKVAEKKVSDLEKEARRLEEAYYAENDPNYRDTVIAARFHQTKQQLDDARKALSDARDEQEKLDKEKPSS